MSTLAPGASGISLLLVCGAAAARTPSVSSLTNALPSGPVMMTLRSLSPMAVAVRLEIE